MKRILIFLFGIMFLPFVCTANSINLIGSFPAINIQRSISGNWKSSSSMGVTVNIDMPGTFKVIIAATSFDPTAWKGKYLRVELENQIDWQSVSVAANFSQVSLVSDGVILPSNDLARNLTMGVHPMIPLKYESTANTSATAVTAEVEITLTILSQ